MLVTNNGTFRWVAGAVTGSGLQNDAATAGDFTIPNQFGTKTLSGLLTNKGHITHEGSTITIPSGGKLLNDTGATYRILGNTGFFRPTTPGTGEIENLGFWEKVGTGVATVPVKFVNRDSLSVTGGSLRLRYDTELTSAGTVAVDRTSDSTAELVIGGDGPNSTSKLNGTTFDLASGGYVNLSSGTHVLSNAVSASGAGLVEQTAGEIIVMEGGSPSINFSQSSPYRVNGFNAMITADNTLLNLGTIIWQRGVLRAGAAVPTALRNNGEISVVGSMTIGTATHGGVLGNRSLVSVLNGASIDLGTLGVFRNDQSEAILRFTGNTSITGTAALQNKGTIEKKETSPTSSDVSLSTIGVFVGDSEAANAIIKSRAGSLRFSGGASFNHSKLSSTNDLKGGGVSGALSRVEFPGAATVRFAEFEFTNGGTIDFLSGSNVIGGACSASGDGALRLLSGTLSASPAVNYNASNGARFEQSGGLLAISESFTCTGTFLKTGGDITGNFTSSTTGSFFFSGGTITSGAGKKFLNQGAFDWTGGAIRGEFENQATDAMPMVLRTLVNKVILSPDGTTAVSFRNTGELEHRDSCGLQLGGMVTLSGSGTYEFVGGGSILGSDTSGEGIVSMSGATIRKTGPNSTASIQVPIIYSGRIEANEGVLVIAGGMGRQNEIGKVSSLRFLTQSGAEIRVLNGEAVAIQHQMSGGVVLYNGQPSPGGHLLELSKGFASTGNGEVRFEGDITVSTTGTTKFSFSATSPGIISGARMHVGQFFDNDGTLIQRGGALIGETSDSSLVNGQDKASAVYSMDGNSVVSFEVGGGVDDKLRFRNKAIINHTGAGNLRLTGDVTLSNSGIYNLLSDADFVEGAPGCVFDNLTGGTLLKNAPGLSQMGVFFSNAGLVEVAQGSLEFTGGVEQFALGVLAGGSWTVKAGTSLSLGGGTITNNKGNVNIEETGVFTNLPDVATVPWQNEGELTRTNAPDFERTNVTNSGEITMTAANAHLTDLDNSGEFTVGVGTVIELDLDLENSGFILVEAGGTVRAGGTVQNRQGGTLQGSGVCDGDVVNQGRAICGQSPGILTVDGNYTQTSTGLLSMEIGGTTAGTDYDVLAVTGAVTLDGTLHVDLLTGGVGLPAGTEFTIVTGTSVTGTFATVDVPKDGAGNPLFSVQYTATSVRLTAAGTLQPVLIDAWRVQHFGTTANEGVTGDLGDFDLDGVPNLIEYALGTDPASGSDGPLMQTDTTGGRLTLTFTRTLANTDITIIVQGADSPTGPWTDLASSVNGGAVTVLATGATVSESGTGSTRTVEVGDAFLIDDPAHPTRFMRVAVTRP